MKRILKSTLAMLLVAVLMLSLVSCGVTKNAEASVKNMLDEFKAGDFDGMAEFSVGEFSTNSAESKKFAEYMSGVLDKLEYEIVSSEQVDDSTVNVTTKITMIDMKPVLSEFFMEMFRFVISNAIAEKEPTSDEMNKQTEEMFIAAVTKPDLATVTNEVVVKVVNTDGAWKVELDDVLTNAMFGGLVKAAEEMSNTVIQ